MKFETIFIILIIAITLFFPSKYVSSSSTETILITISTTMDEIIFDGKWTFPSEWKNSSLDQFTHDGVNVILRSAHQDDFMYFYVDVLHDFTLNEGMDEAIICIDGQNNKNIIFDEDDYCFSFIIGNEQGVVFQGNSNNTNINNFEKILNPEDFIGIGNISDENNRYSKIPHVSYEFKIPIDIIQRSDNYGFFLYVYDADSSTFFTWPHELDKENSTKIHSPDMWGDIISPDKSLPELNLPLIVLMISILSILLLQSKTNILMKQF